MTALKKLLAAEAELKDKDGFAKRHVFIRADVTAPYGKIQDVMAACRELKIYKLQFRVREWEKRKR